MEQKVFWFLCSFFVALGVQLSIKAFEAVWQKRYNEEHKEITYQDMIRYQSYGSFVTTAVFFIIFCFSILTLFDAFVLLLIIALLLCLMGETKISFRGCLKFFSLAALSAFYFEAGDCFGIIGLSLVIILLCMLAWRISKKGGVGDQVEKEKNNKK